MRVVFAGNQNSGKSTLFNLVTGANEAVGNRAGVTVERTEKAVVGSDISAMDTPGIYSLQPFSEEEKVSVSLLIERNYDLIVDVIDGTAPLRGLNLYFELTALNKPIVIVMNMADRMKKVGIIANEELFKKLVGAPVVFLSARNGNGVKELISLINESAPKNESLQKPIGNGKNDKTLNFPTAYDTPEKRFLKAEKIVSLCFFKRKKATFGELLDKAVLHPIAAIPVFFAIMFVVYTLSVGSVGKAASDGIAALFSFISEKSEGLMRSANFSLVTISFITDGALAGVCTALTFIPQLFTLQLLLSALEATGYMTRAAFVFERLLSAIGLSGRSLVPFIVGSGCSVPAIYSTRTIPSKREKELTIMLVPFVPCSAKLPMIALFADFFFPTTSGIAAFSTYVSAIVIIVFSALTVKFFVPSKAKTPFIYELTDYKVPDIKIIFKDAFSKIGSFAARVGTTVFISSIIIWALSSFSLSSGYVSNADDSILAGIGKLISPLFAPVIGVNSWQATVCCLQGFIAKEQVVSSMSVIAGAEGAANVFSSKAFGFFDAASAYSFVIFNLFSPPCIGAVAAMRKETGTKKTAIAVVYQLSIAFVISSLLRLLLSLFI